MIILLWAEGGNNIGSGHLNRVIDIYNVLKGEYNVEFYASEEDSIEFYKKTGINLTDIKNLHKNDYILVSDLKYPEKYSEILYYLSKNSYKHISINDMGLAQRDADIIIDGHIKNFEEYKKNPLTEYYLGTDYFILKTRFRHFNKVRRKIRKKANKIYLTLGGWSRVEDLRYISRKYYEADITIAAGGISYYEAASTGSPIIMFYKDDYQKFIVESLMEKGYGISAGKLSNFDENNFLKLLSEYKYDFDSRNKHSIIGKQLVDGLGIYRLKKIIEKL
jgi:spore coat polysaccharide biosynthesis predicted glycosyltransferase SpsG